MTENKKFYLREMDETDHKDFLETANEESGVSFNADEKFSAVFLAACQQSTTILSIIDSYDQNYIGYVMIKHTNTLHTNTLTPELGISIRSEYRCRGIGTEAMEAAADLYARSNPLDHYLIRVKAYNSASRRMIEKLGAQRLEDEGDVMLDVVKRLAQELGAEQGKNCSTIFWTDMMSKAKKSSNIGMISKKPRLCRHSYIIKNEKRKSHEESCDSSWDFGALVGTRIPGPLIKSSALVVFSCFVRCIFV